MSIGFDLLAYLDHFQVMMPVAELYDHRGATDRSALCHDVDHSLDLALELAWIEAERDLRASYYLLTATRTLQAAHGSGVSFLNGDDNLPRRACRVQP